jgi:hypothetical protein
MFIERKEPFRGSFLLCYFEMTIDDVFVLFTTERATGYKITIIIVFSAIAGKTPAANKAVKELGKSTM